MPKDLMINGLLLVATCAALFAIGEVLMRVTYAESDVLITLDECTGFKPIASMDGFVLSPDGSRPIHIRTNSAGFRDVEHSPEKDPGIYRILFLGDSFTEAIQVPVEETFWRRMQSYADRKDLPVEILSFGVSSFGTDQQLLAYQCYGHTYQPDLVVLNFYNGNDPIDNYFRTDPFVPRFALSEGRLTLDESYKERVAARQKARATIFPGALYWFKDHSSLTRFLYKKFDYWRRKEELANRINVSGTNPIFEREQTAEWEKAWLLTEALILRLRESVRADGADLLIVQLPSVEEIRPTLITEPQRYDLDKPARRLAAFSDNHGIPLISLTATLVKADEEKPIDWAHDTHWNARGHEAVAGALIEQLAAFVPPLADDES